MEFIRWYDNYCFNIDEIDNDHQHLFSVTNRLAEMVYENRPADDFMGILDALLSYCENHFDREERLLAEWQYPGLKGHAARHRELAEQVREFRDIHHKSPDELNRHEVLLFLKRWLKNHILVEDRAYSDYIRKQERLSSIG